MILNYAQLLLGWPFLSFIFLSIFLYTFKDTIKDLIRRMHSDHPLFKIQQSNTTQDKSINSNIIQDNKSSTEKIDINKEYDKLLNIANQWRQTAYIWEYRYLSYYLVPNTKQVLGWLNDNKSVPIEIYDSLWRNSIPEANERIAILDALKRHNLIFEKDNILNITDKGSEYISVSQLL